MRAVYLAIAGYLVGFFAQQRANYEARVRELEAQAERQSIARMLHDSYVQSLAGVNLRLESCRELLRRKRPDDASRELKELQLGVKRQFDEVREYVRSLAGVDSNSTHEVADISADPEIRINGVFDGSSRLQILSILEPLLPNNRSIERDYSPVWSLWRAEKNPKTGAASQSLLWNLYRRDAAPASRKCSLLFGLFQYESGSEGKRVRLFYISVVKTRPKAGAIQNETQPDRQADLRFSGAELK